MEMDREQMGSMILCGSFHVAPSWVQLLRCIARYAQCEKNIAGYNPKHYHKWI